MQCVYDKDTFSFDDKMGDADIDIGPFLKALKMHLEGIPDGITISKVQPSNQNCLTEESCIVWSGGRLVQNMILRLRNVECGEVELQLRSDWCSKIQGLVLKPRSIAISIQRTNMKRFTVYSFDSFVHGTQN